MRREGEPGTGKDRVILSGDPHAVIEGMAICGVAVGADKGFIYLRAEYPQVRETLEKAVSDARANGYLGKGILGSKLDFDIEIRSGAGSYVCGEETGLIESMEGNRGEPRLRPPYPAVAGLWGRPTVINNVETLANIPVIMSIGADGYRKVGTEKCPGTKLFTLSGNIVNPGVYEFPMGVTMRQLFEDVGGGCPNGKKLKGIQVGGSASGVFVTPDMLDAPLDMESCAAAGMSLGTGSLHVLRRGRRRHRAVPRLHGVFRRRVVRKVHALPLRQQANRGHSGRHSVGQGQDGGYRKAREALGLRQQEFAVRAWAGGADAGTVGA